MTLSSTLAARCVNTLRCLALDAVEAAGAGHAGTPLGAAPAAFVLWDRFLRHAPRQPQWPNRDRFVLSCGHASLLLYGLLHLTGYDLALDEIRRFRQFGSKAPGHPERGRTPGVEMTTGPLGQGFAHAVGLAMAEAHLAARYNRPGFPLIDHRTFVMASDGDLQEGVSAEAAGLAGTLGLGKLVALYDANEVQIEGPTALASAEDLALRFRASRWNVIGPVDGQALDQIAEALEQALAESRAPSLIVVRTRIGQGSPLQGSHKAHHGPLGPERLVQTKAGFDWPQEPAFFVPPEVAAHMGLAVGRGEQAVREWRALFERYGREHPRAAAELDAALAGRLPAGWGRGLGAAAIRRGGALAPRAVSGEVLNELAARVPALLGGSADLFSSTKTQLREGGTFTADDAGGRTIYFGVREHCMAAAAGGMAVHGGLRPYVSTYLVFADYLRPALRLACMMGLPVIYVFTHDSIHVGMDGPTHQAVEQIMSLRALPNLLVLRPGDARETVEAWKAALRNRRGPTALILARQALPTLDRRALAPASGLRRGAYTLWQSRPGRPELLLIGSGSELPLALEAGRRLAAAGRRVRVVSMPSWELFDRQPAAYRARVLPPEVRARLSVEAGTTPGWERYVGLDGLAIGVDRFGHSAPAGRLAKLFGLTAERVAERAEELLRARRRPTGARRPRR